MALHVTTNPDRLKLEKARKYLRLFIMDTPELNRLIKRYESSDEQLELAIDLTVDDWNTSPPPIAKLRLANYPSLWLLLHGATIQLLKMQGLYQSRNEMQYNSGGSGFTRFNKTPHYQSWLQLFINEYERKKRDQKIAMNVQGGYGGVHSEYYSLGWW